VHTDLNIYSERDLGGRDDVTVIPASVNLIEVTVIGKLRLSQFGRCLHRNTRDSIYSVAL
jgi:hypothetical protein